MSFPHLITGGTGFIGCNLADYLLRQKVSTYLQSP
ncbi:NAD-dependent epimerase/dehydratase family protein [uncultured Chloroflexus sp.]